MNPTDEMSGAQMTEYTPDSIREITEILAPQAGNYTNAITGQIGQAQQSMGPLAAATMGQSKTSGLGNYTYNRLMRPQVDVMRDEILVEGYRNQLNRALSDAYNTARRNYSRRAGRTGGGGNDGNNNDPENKGTTGVTKITGSGDKSTGSGKTTSWTNLPNSYQWLDDDGNWRTATRGKVFTDEDWLKTYQDVKNKYSSQGRFKG